MVKRIKHKICLKPIGKIELDANGNPIGPLTKEDSIILEFNKKKEEEEEKRDKEIKLLNDTTIDLIFKSIAKYNTEAAKSQTGTCTKLRSLLEFAYAYYNNPSLKFEAHNPKDIGDSLYNNMENYYKQHNSSLYNIATELRKQLNYYVHNAATCIPSTEIVFDFIRKTTQILNPIFNRKVELEDSEHMLSILDINPEQQHAVDCNDRTILVNAGPGTGKTYLIVDRIIHSARLSGEKKIIGISFTNESAKELRKRFEYKIFATKDICHLDKVKITTLHSFLYSQLKEFYSESDIPFEYDFIDDETYRQIKEDYRNDMNLVKAYLDDNNLFTFDDVINVFSKTLVDTPKLIEYLSQNIYEIIIDEAQDLDEKCYKILKQIHDYSKTLRIFAVGDPRQNIFGFRGGSLKNFTGVGFSPTKFSLRKSYRCPNNILEFVNKLKFEDGDFEDLYNDTNIGEAPSHNEYYDEKEEAEKIALEIAKIKKNNDNINYSDISILLPDRYSFSTYNEQLSRNNIPYKNFGGTKEIKPIVSEFLNLIGAINHKKHCLLQLLNYNEIAYQYNCQKGISYEKIFSELRNNMEFKTIYNIIKNPTYKSFIEIADEYIKAALHFITNEDIVILHNFCNKLDKYQITSYSEIRKLVSPNAEDFTDFYHYPNTKIDSCKLKTNDAVTISTIHSAKGKEWAIVFIPRLAYGLFPSRKDNLNEATKKFYVACTRCKQKLYLSYAYHYYNSKGSLYPFKKSMFLELLEQEK